MYTDKNEYFNSIVSNKETQRMDILTHALIQIGVFTVGIILILFRVIIVYTNEAVIIERLGKFNRVLGVGWHVYNSFIETPKVVTWRRTVEDHNGTISTQTFHSNRIPIGKQKYDFPPIECTTRDSCVVTVNGLVYFNIVCVNKAVYDIPDLYDTIEQLVYCVIRSTISDFTLEEALTQRLLVRDALQTELERRQDQWGIVIKELQIQSIIAPPAILLANENAIVEQRRVATDKLKQQALFDAEMRDIDHERAVLEKRLASKHQEHQSELSRREAESAQTYKEEERRVAAKRLYTNDMTPMLLEHDVHCRYAEAILKGTGNNTVVPYTALTQATQGAFFSSFTHTKSK